MEIEANFRVTRDAVRTRKRRNFTYVLRLQRYIHTYMGAAGSVVTEADIAKLSNDDVKKLTGGEFNKKDLRKAWLAAANSADAQKKGSGQVWVTREVFEEQLDAVRFMTNATAKSLGIKVLPCLSVHGCMCLCMCSSRPPLPRTFVNYRVTVARVNARVDGDLNSRWRMLGITIGRRRRSTQSWWRRASSTASSRWWSAPPNAAAGPSRGSTPRRRSSGARGRRSCVGHTL